MKRILLIAALAVVIGCVLAEMKLRQHAAQSKNERAKNVTRVEPPRTAEPPVAVPQPSPPEIIPPPASTPAPESRPKGPPPVKPKSPPPIAPVQSGRNEIQDPMARLALSLVGVDPYAEAYWMDAINDPGLSANERKDLIEDLNEDGFADPRHPAAEELPLIWNRLQLIERLLPYSMDEVNQDAFLEAYKDLSNMLRGLPVQ